MASKLKSLYASARNRASQETNDPPPAYTPTAATSSKPAIAPSAEPNAAPSSYTPTTTAAAAGASTDDDDPFAFLCAFDTVFLIDDSSSMNGRAGYYSPSSPCYSSCWDEVADVLRAIVPICTARDADGIDLYFLNHRSRSPSAFYSPPSGKAAGGYYNIRSAADVSSIFQSVVPCGTTPTGERLEQIIAPYLKGLEKSAAKKQQSKTSSSSSSSAAAGGGEAVRKNKKENKKPMNLIVITDGRPTDDPTGVLVDAASRLVAARAPVAQLGVQFFQVGRDAGARAALQELDDGLIKYSGRDIVDCVTWDDERAGKGVLTAEGILKAVLGAVSRRLDWKILAWSRPTVTKKHWNF
ncbi:hypothetical protein MY4038_006705 [Beauveria bassiana]